MFCPGCEVLHMIEFLKMFFSNIWELFSIKWPGFEFSIGSVFLAATVSVGALTAILKMVGVQLPDSDFVGQLFASRRNTGGNNSLIVISDERRLDTK